VVIYGCPCEISTGPSKIKNNSKKKTTYYKERNDERRKEFIDKISKISKDDLIYVD
jgi:hypothetical protein